MIPRYKRAICIFGKHSQNNLPLMLGSINYPVLNDASQQVRSIKKHWNPKFRKERKEKFGKVELPNFENEDPTDSYRSYLKKLGVLPQREWRERPLLVSCTPQIYDGYVAPEGDGKFSSISLKGAKQKFDYIEKKGKSFMSIKKIRSYDENFKTKSFAEEALEIYKKAHEALCTRKEDEILQYVTEYAYPFMIHNMMDKTIVWKFLESLEAPYVVHARVASIIVKHNQFAQVTVRFHSQQLLSVYDRFGRLMYGSETVKKDVLDYIVFEKHLSNLYGVWRLHGKIVPDWIKEKDIPSRTYISQTEQSPFTLKGPALELSKAKVTDATDES